MAYKMKNSVQGLCSSPLQNKKTQKKFKDNNQEKPDKDIKPKKGLKQYNKRKSSVHPD